MEGRRARGALGAFYGSTVYNCPIMYIMSSNDLVALTTG